MTKALYKNKEAQQHNKLTMDSDSKNLKISDGEKQQENSDPLPGNLPFHESIRIRLPFQNDDGMDRELLGSGHYILWYCGIISWIIFLLFGN